MTSTPRSNQTITFGTLPSKTSLDSSFELNATASSGLAVSYVSSNPAVATVEGSSVSIVAQGVTTIRASQDGNESFNPAPFVEQDLMVSKVDQAITFNSIPSQLLSAGTYTLNATASSGLGINFVSEDPAVASISGNVASLIKGGTTKITAKQTGNSIYNAAPEASQILIVVDVFTNVPPTVANPIPDVNATEDDPDATVNLSGVFDDVDDNNSLITKTAVSNDEQLVMVTVNGDLLTLDFQTDANGSALITVTGTSNGMIANDVFSVNVAGVDDPPIVANALADLNATEDSPQATVSLSSVFNDIDDDNASIAKTALSSAPALVTATVSGD